MSDLVAWQSRSAGHLTVVTDIQSNISDTRQSDVFNSIPAKVAKIRWRTVPFPE